MSTVFGDVSYTLWPELFNLSEPTGDLVPEEPLDRILLGPKLVAQSIGAEEWNTRWRPADCPTLPGDPNVEI